MPCELRRGQINTYQGQPRIDVGLFIAELRLFVKAKAAVKV